MGSTYNYKGLYSQDFQALLDRLAEEDNSIDGEELDNGNKWRKRKLSFDQVKDLKRKFEEDPGLGRLRKATIAAELGLEPSQVYIWFQNQRAKCKTKHLEKAFRGLQAVYAALRQDYDSLERKTKSLVAEVRELEAKLEAKNELKEGNVNVAPSTSALVSPAMMEMLIDEAFPLPLSPWWSTEEAYVSSQQPGFLGDGELGGVITSSTSTWDRDVFSSFDPTYF